MSDGLGMIWSHDAAAARGRDAGGGCMIKWVVIGILGLLVWRAYALYDSAQRARQEAEDALPPDWSEVDPHRAALIRDSGREWRS